VLVLEEYEHAKARGARIYAEYVGGAFTCDAHHMTEPQPEGKGVALCINRALDSAGAVTALLLWLVLLQNVDSDQADGAMVAVIRLCTAYSSVLCAAVRVGRVAVSRGMVLCFNRALSSARICGRCLSRAG
jgi:hypothetical protein